MNVVCLFAWGPDFAHWDWMCDPLLHGLVHRYGSANVSEYFGHKQYASPEILLGDGASAITCAHVYSGPRSTRPVRSTRRS